MPEGMDSRTRVMTALDHNEPDRVPIDFWSTREVDERLMEYLSVTDREAMLDNFDVDLRYMAGPAYIGPEPATHPDGSSEDIWGVQRVTQLVDSDPAHGSYVSVTKHPLANADTPADVAAYAKWPSPDWFDYTVVADQARRIREAGRVVVFMGDRLNRIAQWKPAQYLRGMEQIMVDMAVDPDMWWAIVGRITDFYLEYLGRILESAGGLIDILFTGDDFGSQKGMLCSPEMWRRYLRPGFEKFIAKAKQHDCRVAHHTCGSVWPIVKDMVDCGLDILNPLQPNAAAMDMKLLKQQFGRDLVFHGSIDIQHTLPHGTPKRIRGEVKDRMEVLAPGGGFIYCTAHNIQADTPTENVLALIDAYRTIARYRRPDPPAQEPASD